MPNLLKSLPEEILAQEDKRFIYNVLNPLMFEKKKLTTSKIKKVLNAYELFNEPSLIPSNTDYTDISIYATLGNKKEKVGIITNETQAKELISLKENIKFIFSLDETDTLYSFFKFYDKVQRNKIELSTELKEIENYLKDEIIIEERYALEQQKERLEQAIALNKNYESEFELLFNFLVEVPNYSYTQNKNRLINDLANLYGIRSFDEEIIISGTYLVKYFIEQFNGTKEFTIFKTNGYDVVGSTTQELDFYGFLFVFVDKILTLKNKLDEYNDKMVLDDNMVYFERGNTINPVTPTYKNQIITNESNNVTYFLDRNSNKLEIYLYIDRNYRLNDNIKLFVDGVEIKKSIITPNGTRKRGFEISSYYDMNFLYYKITVEDFLLNNPDGGYLNDNINEVKIQLDLEPVTVITQKSTVIYSKSFLDNFKVYKLNKISGFYEELKMPITLHTGLEENLDMYLRYYKIDTPSPEFASIINDIENEFIITYSEFDYQDHVHYFTSFFDLDPSKEIELSYDLVDPFVMLEEQMNNEITIPCHQKVEIEDYFFDFTNLELMGDGQVYKKLYYLQNNKITLNPYCESNVQPSPKMTMSEFMKRFEMSENLVKSKLSKIGFYRNFDFQKDIGYDYIRELFVVHPYEQRYIIDFKDKLTKQYYSDISYDSSTNKVYYKGLELCDNDIIFLPNKIYLRNKVTGVFEELPLFPVESINQYQKENEIYFDIFTNKHVIKINGNYYSVEGLVFADNEVALTYEDQAIFYVENKTGLFKFKTKEGILENFNFKDVVFDLEEIADGKILIDIEHSKIHVRYDIRNIVELELKPLVTKPNHVLTGLNINSLYYIGNFIPGNNNSDNYGREGIFDSIHLIDDAYKIGEVEDYSNDDQKHSLLYEQFNLSLADAEEMGQKVEPFLKSKTEAAKFKGLESFLKSNLKLISDDIEIDPVYLVQRNRFISEWFRLTKNSEKDYSLIKDSIKRLVADLFETKLINSEIDDLINLSESNQDKGFSIITNNPDEVLEGMMKKIFEDNNLYELFNYYLIFDVWLVKNKDLLTNYIIENGTDDEKLELSSLDFDKQIDRERFYYIFCEVVRRNGEEIIDSYIPISDYETWELYEQNNSTYFEKPFKYSIIDVKNFILHDKIFNKPVYLIRPLNQDNVFVRKDYRLLDLSIITEGIFTEQDDYNEYLDGSYELYKDIDYLDETLRVLEKDSLERNYDYLGVNFVIVRWIVERVIPEKVTSQSVLTREDLDTIIKDELMQAEHPNEIIEYNRIKESTYLKDLGFTPDEIYETIIDNSMLVNNYINLKIVDSEELVTYDKIKKPAEYYFDFLIEQERYELIAQALAIFTEDVIITSMVDLSIALNIKDMKGETSYKVYEQVIRNIFDEYLPFHTVLERILFTIKILEGSAAEAISKELDVGLDDVSYIDVLHQFTEKLKIYTSERLYSSSANVIIPTRRMVRTWGHDEIPYNYDQKMKEIGHDEFGMGDFAVDDQWLVQTEEDWLAAKSENIYTPPEFAKLDFIEKNPDDPDIEQVADINLSEYYHLTQNQIESDARILPKIYDRKPFVGIDTNDKTVSEVKVLDNYLAKIDVVFNLRFFDQLSEGYDEFGYGMNSEPDTQQTLIGVYDLVLQEINQKFIDKLQIQVLDSVWSSIKTIYNYQDIPGHDLFPIDENYHQASPFMLGLEISTLVTDKLEINQRLEVADIPNISLLDDEILLISQNDKEVAEITITEKVELNISLWPGRNKPSGITEEGNTIPGNNEFGVDKYYHDSYDDDRLDNSITLLTNEHFGVVKVDFGFKRIYGTVQEDPYNELIDNQFYRLDKPTSFDVFGSRIRDLVKYNINTFLKEKIQVVFGETYFTSAKMITSEYSDNLMEISAIDTDERISFSYQVFFKEEGKITEQFAKIIDNELVVERGDYLESEKDELFNIYVADAFGFNLGQRIKDDNKISSRVRDVLETMILTEDDLVVFKHNELPVEISFKENLQTYFDFVEKTTITINEESKDIINQINFDKTEYSLLDRIYYGEVVLEKTESVGIFIQDNLREVYSNKIHKDSLTTLLSEPTIESVIDLDYNFDERYIIPKHNENGHMGFTDESVTREISTKLDESLTNVIYSTEFEQSNLTLIEKMFSGFKITKEEKTQIQIMDSLETYINIIQNPRILGIYDEFGHDLLPHMFDDKADEFGITTLLKENIIIESYIRLNDNGVLSRLSENLDYGYRTEFKDSISVQMNDLLSNIGVVIKERLTIDSNDITRFRRHYEEPLQVGLLDRVTPGLVFEENRPLVTFNETLSYGYLDYYMKDDSSIKLGDWLFKSYQLETTKAEIQLADKVVVGFGFEPMKDYSNITFKENLEVDEFRTNIYKDTLSIITNDKYFSSIDVKGLYDSFSITFVDEKNLGYGKGIKLYDSLRVYFLNLLWVDDYSETQKDLIIDLKETLKITATPYGLDKEASSVDFYERLKIGFNFKDYTNVFFEDTLAYGYTWLVTQYGHSELIYTDDLPYEYLNGSEEQSVFGSLIDKSEVAIETIFKDKLQIGISGRLTTKLLTDMGIEGINTEIFDSVLYGFGVMDNALTEVYPHDEYEYDETPHNDGSTESEITTGVQDTFYGVIGQIFTETVSVGLSDTLMFGDGQINRESLSVGYIEYLDSEIVDQLREDQIQITYLYEDDMITQEYREGYKDIITLMNEEFEIIEQIFKYRFYEKIFNLVQDGQLIETLQEFEDSIQIISGYNLKLYGDLTPDENKTSATLREKATSDVSMFFYDVLGSLMQESLSVEIIEDE